LSQLILILGIAGLIWLYILFKRKPDIKEKVSLEMVRCVTCGVNIPKSEAIGSEEHWFCSEEHRT
tara:strand:- start:171 stop:365 length:195 start_codon:yes stop_codon:yes gene_type:complete